MNDTAILTVKDGEELLTSGIFLAVLINETHMQVDFGPELGMALVEIQDMDFDPVKVGVVEGQKRFTWSGTFELDEVTGAKCA